MNELQKLKQSMEVWLESFEVFCTSTQILSETWKTFHNRSPYKLSSPTDKISPFQDVSAEVDKVMTDIHLHLQPAIHDIFKNRCLKPVTFILSLVPGIHEQIQQRKLLLLDFDSYKSKIQKEHAAGRDSSHPNVARKAVKLDESAKKLHALQTTLSKTLDEFEIARPLTLGPELAAYVACMHSFSSSMYNSTSSLLPVIPQAVSTLAILDSQVTASKIYTDKLTSMRGTGLAQKVPLNTSKRILTTVEPISVRPMVMGGIVGGYGESLQVVGPSMQQMQHGNPIPPPPPRAIAPSIVEEISVSEAELSASSHIEETSQEEPSSNPVDNSSHRSKRSSYRLDLNAITTQKVIPNDENAATCESNNAPVLFETGKMEVEASDSSSSPPTFQPTVPPPKPPRRKPAILEGEQNHVEEKVDVEIIGRTLVHDVQDEVSESTVLEDSCHHYHKPEPDVETDQ